MNTRKIFGYGLLTVLITLAFIACEQPTDTPTVTLTGITAVYTQGSTVIYPTTPLDSLKAGLTVTAAYSNGTNQPVTSYTLSVSGSGTLTVGTSAVTVSYTDSDSVTKTTTFTVTVTAAPGGAITYTAVQTGGADKTADTTGIVFTFNGPVDSLNLAATDITVGGTAAKGTAATFAKSGGNWLLSPITVSAAGTATVKITKGGIETGTKNVTVFKEGQSAPTLTGITAVYTQGSTIVYPTTLLDSLKANLTVKAQYSNDSENTLSDNEYTLSGALAVGTSTVTVSYTSGVTKTAAFTVTVTAAPNTTITYTAAQTGGADNTADTTAINFTFSASVTGLTANDITVTNGTGSVTKGTLSGSGTSWTLGVTVTTAGNVTIAITKTGIEAGTKPVTVYKQGQTAPTLTGITAAYTQGSTIVYPTTSLDSLKAGLTVTAAYSNGTTHPVTAYALSVSGSGTLTVGSSAVTVTYEGKTTTFTVTVTAAPATKTLTGITLNTDSVKRDYNQNETLNLTGLVVTANYSDSTSAVVSYTSTSPANGATLSTAGTITVTVNYTEGTVTRSNTFTVTVTAAPAAKTLTSITLNTDSVKKDYDQNEQLDLTGLAVTSNYSDSTSAAVSYTSTSPANESPLSTAGIITVTVNYTEGTITRSNTFTVTVTAAPTHIHQWSEWSVTTAATCMATGTGIRTCAICGEEETVIPINPNAHQLDPNYIITQPTCISAGSGAIVCLLNPAHSNPNQIVVLPLNPDAHDWNTTYTTLTDATVTTDGIEAITCKRDSSHTKEAHTLYATGTAGLAYELTENAYRVRKGSVSSGEVHIPAYYRPSADDDYLPVTEIGSSDDGWNGSTYIGAFSGTEITSITIPASVTSISRYAFYNCTGITGITIPEGVTSIGYSAFSGCTGLTSITIPEGVTSIGDSAFSGCTSLTSITIPASVTSISYWGAFLNCTGLTSITVDGNNWNFTSEGGILYNKAKTTLIAYPSASGSVTIPEGVTSIGIYAFYGCSSLTSITIPASVTSIGGQAFYGCSSLTSVTIPEGVTSIGEWAFYGCTSLTSITIPTSVTSIDGQAFYGCSSLTSITIPEGVTSIGQYTFYGCRSLISVTIPDSVTSIGWYAFQNCRALTSITIPASVTSIGDSAFRNCTGLTSITIPASVTSISGWAFLDCSSLTSVTFEGTIASGSFSGNVNGVAVFPGDLRNKFYATDSANGTPGTYTRPSESTTWTRQE